jgi:hypothetical protein
MNMPNHIIIDLMTPNRLPRTWGRVLWLTVLKEALRSISKKAEALPEYEFTVDCFDCSLSEAVGSIGKLTVEEFCINVIGETCCESKSGSL